MKTPIDDRLRISLDVIRHTGFPALLVGPHGIGKSAFLLDYAELRSMQPYVLDLSLMEAPDLTGLPYREGGRTRYAAPATLPHGSGPSLLVLEELNRCDPSVRQPCLQLLTARRLNEYHLPDGCFVVASTNPDGGEYDVDVLDPALQSRFVRIDVCASAKEWLAWAAQAGVAQGVIDFVAAHPTAIDRAPPRAWSHAAALLDSAHEHYLAPQEVAHLLDSVLPPLTAKALLRSLEIQLPRIDPVELLRRPDLWLPRFEVWMGESRMDLVDHALDRLRDHLEQEGPPPHVPEALMQLLRLVPPDLAAPVHALLEAA